MKTIFHNVGYTLDEKKRKANQRSIHVYYIRNNDGSPRWIWNAKNESPLFLKHYTVNNTTSYWFIKYMQLIFKLRLQHLFLRHKKWYYCATNSPLFDIQGDWALYTGNQNANNSSILYANKTIYKISTTKKSEQLLHNEYQFIKNLQGTSTTFAMPSVHYINQRIIQLSDISEKNQKNTAITETHLKVLNEMIALRKQSIQVRKWPWFSHLEDEFLALQDNRIPKNILRKIERVLDLINPDEVVTIGLTHGDFTSSNITYNQNYLALQNWEFARMDRPFAFDYFHFIIQNGVLDQRKNWKTIEEDLKNQSVDTHGNCLFAADTSVYKNQLKWYLLTHCMHYLKFQLDPHIWSDEVQMLVNVWNEAFDAILENYKTPTEFLIMDVFDSIQNCDYGALNFPEVYPDLIKKGTIVSLVTQKQQAKKMCQLLKNHHLVASVYIQNKSFQYCVRVVTIDGGMMNFELIWQVKIRELEVMNAFEVYKNNNLSRFGIKNARTIDSARHVILSILLTNKKTPNYDSQYALLLEKSQNVLDILITFCLKNKSNDVSKLISFLKKEPKNNSFSYYQNLMNYYVDSFKKFKKQQMIWLILSG